MAVFLINSTSMMYKINKCINVYTCILSVIYYYSWGIYYFNLINYNILNNERIVINIFVQFITKQNILLIYLKFYKRKHCKYKN